MCEQNSSLHIYSAWTRNKQIPATTYSYLDQTRHEKRKQTMQTIKQKREKKHSNDTTPTKLEQSEIRNNIQTIVEWYKTSLKQ